VLCAVLAALVSSGTHSTAEEKKLAIKGKIQGGETLLNPVWVEASSAEKHRYTFRTRSTSVGKRAQRQTAYLPKELCIAVLRTEGSAAARGTPAMVGVSGGRTTPVTLVVAEGQAVQFINYDPFSHKLYDTSQGGLGPEETKGGASRSWKPPKAGVYELRDQLFPSVRSWVVVEPRVVQTGYPSLGGDFLVSNLEPGKYDLQGFFMGKPVGKSLPIEVIVGAEEQQIHEPLVVAEAKKEDEGK
jgi:hypothetical protein